MKKIFASLIVIATITFSAQAQTERNNANSATDSSQNGARKYHRGPGHKQMAEQLQLTNDQKQQMKAINGDMKSKMADLKSSNLSTEELNAKKAEIRKERKQKMMALLTPAQKDKMKQFKKEQHKKREMVSAKRMEKMKQKLALSDDQVTKINAQREAYKTKFETIKNNQSLSMDEKKAQMKSIREEKRNNFKSLLTPDQVKKMEEMKQSRAGKTSS